MTSRADGRLSGSNSVPSRTSVAKPLCWYEVPSSPATGSALPDTTSARSARNPSGAYDVYGTLSEARCTMIIDRDQMSALKLCAPKLALPKMISGGM